MRPQKGLLFINNLLAASNLQKLTVHVGFSECGYILRNQRNYGIPYLSSIVIESYRW